MHAGETAATLSGGHHLNRMCFTSLATQVITFSYILLISHFKVSDLLIDGVLIPLVPPCVTTLMHSLTRTSRVVSALRRLRFSTNSSSAHFSDSQKMQESNIRKQRNL